MADGYGFAGEGDWKTVALVRAIKVMGHGMSGAASFMEDYTYDLMPGPERVLGSHMLEVCPTIADGKPRVEIHRLALAARTTRCAWYSTRRRDLRSMSASSILAIVSA